MSEEIGSKLFDLILSLNNRGDTDKILLNFFNALDLTREKRSSATFNIIKTINSIDVGSAGSRIVGAILKIEIYMDWDLPDGTFQIKLKSQDNWSIPININDIDNLDKIIKLSAFY